MMQRWFTGYLLDEFVQSIAMLLRPLELDPLFREVMERLGYSWRSHE